MGQRLRDGIAEQARRYNLGVRQSGPPQMPTILFEDDADYAKGYRFVQETLKRGVYMHPKHNMFLSARAYRRGYRSRVVGDGRGLQDRGGALDCSRRERSLRRTFGSRRMNRSVARRGIAVALALGLGVSFGAASSAHAQTAQEGRHAGLCQRLRSGHARSLHGVERGRTRGHQQYLRRPGDARQRQRHPPHAGGEGHRLGRFQDLLV